MYIEKVKAKIDEQQRKVEGTPAFYVGEQLKAICSRSEKIAEIVLEDLNNPDMSIEAAEKQIKKYADETHKNARSFCVTPDKAEEIIKKFYGIDSIVEDSPTLKPAESADINLDDFI